MNRYFKAFLYRGMIFAGFGPIVMGIIYGILDLTIEDFSVGGTEVLVAIVSTYLLAFIQGGASVFNQIEHWPLAKSLLFHFSSIYLAYLCCYIVNTWIPFEPIVILIFSGVFLVSYFIIWFSVTFAVKATEKKLNERIANKQTNI